MWQFGVQKQARKRNGVFPIEWKIFRITRMGSSNVWMVFRWKEASAVWLQRTEPKPMGWNLECRELWLSLTRELHSQMNTRIQEQTDEWVSKGMSHIVPEGNGKFPIATVAQRWQNHMTGTIRLLLDSILGLGTATRFTLTNSAFMALALPCLHFLWVVELPSS